MIQSTATHPTTPLIANAARDRGQEPGGDSSGAGVQNRFELAIAALFPAPTTDVSRAESGRFGGVAASPRDSGEGARGVKEKGKRSRADAEPSTGSHPDPRIVAQQPVLQAQERLMRSADVADRAAAELRGEGEDASPASTGDREESAARTTQNQSHKDGAASRANVDSSASHARAATLDQHAVSPDANTTAKGDHGASRTVGPASAASSNGQQHHGGSQSDAGGTRQQQTGTQTNSVGRAQSAATRTLGANSVANPSVTTQNAGSTSAPTASSATPSVGGPGSLATLRDPLRAYAARAQDKATKPPADQTLTNQVARGLAAAVRQRDGTLTLRLSPDALGDIKIQVRVESGHVSAHIDAQSEQARQLLSDTASTLRSALEAHGLVVERIEVAPAERHATNDPVIAHSAPITEQHRAQGGALSDPDQPPPQGIGDGATPDHSDRGHNSASNAQDASSSVDEPLEALGATDGAMGLERVDDRWVLRVDLVA